MGNLVSNRSNHGNGVRLVVGTDQENDFNLLCLLAICI